MPLLLEPIIDDELSVPSVPVLTVPKKTFMDIIRYFECGLTIKIDSAYDNELNVITEDTNTHTYTVGNVKNIYVYMGNKCFQYDVSTNTVVKNEDTTNIVKTGNIVDITISENIPYKTPVSGVYRINLTNSPTVTFSNVSFPSSNFVH